MVKNAISRFNLNSYECNNIQGKFDIIIMHNAFFYIHPKKQFRFLEKLSKLLNERGRLYITDTPDFSKRRYGIKRLHYIISFIIPVYQIELAGFFVKDKLMKKYAKKLNMKLSKYDSWSNYRSHWILEKE